MDRSSWKGSLSLNTFQGGRVAGLEWDFLTRFPIIARGSDGGKLTVVRALQFARRARRLHSFSPFF